MNVTLTPAAEKFMRRMVRFGGQGEKAGFRLVVTPGGCSGLSSEFSIEAGPQAEDRLLESNGLQIFLPEESAALLEGATIDFADTPMTSGLVFHNAQSSCACSTSSNAPPSSGAVSLDSIGRRG